MEGQPSEEPVVSVVIIGRNEAPFLEACLRKARSQGASAGAACELIYVDSASTDGSAGLAAPLCDAVLARSSDWPPFAGRLLGLRAARGEFVQFLDADMEIAPGWFAYALHAMREAALDAVCGAVLAPAAPQPPAGSGEAPHPLSAERLEGADNGATLFRRSSLLSIGGHHPGLVGLDNSEVLIRACAQGLRVARTETACVRHLRTRPDEGLLARVKRKMRHEYPGTGQALRLSLRGPRTYRAALRRRVASPIGVLATAAVVVAAGLFLRPPPLLWGGLAVLVVGVALAVQSARKRSLRAGALSVVDLIGNASGLVIGLFVPLPEPSAYHESLKPPPQAPVQGPASDRKPASAG